MLLKLSGQTTQNLAKSDITQNPFDAYWFSSALIKLEPWSSESSQLSKTCQCVEINWINYFEDSFLMRLVISKSL